MIRLTQYLCVALLLLSPLALAAPVVCTPDVITLTSQAEVDDFQANHGPGCDTIVSMLTISGASITDLTPLAGLTTAGWNSTLLISGTSVTSFAGLEGLTSVFFFEISGNTLLTDISALASLVTHSSALLINGNTSLTNLNGLENVTELPIGGLFIERNSNLTDLSGVSNITSIGASLVIDDNDSLVNLNDLAGLTHVPSNMSVSRNDALTDISALGNLVDFESIFYLQFNSQLAQLGDLSNMTNLAGLNIRSNSSLNNVDGFSGLKTIADSGLSISYNNSLNNLNGLAALEASGSDVFISDNPLLDQCSTLEKLLDAVDDGLPGPGPGDAGIPDVDGDVTIENNKAGCNSVNDIVGAPTASSFHYGGPGHGNQHVLLKASGITQNCLSSAIELPHGGRVLTDRLLSACASVAYQGSDTLIYNTGEHSCQVFEEFRGSTRLDVHGTYLANMISGNPLEQHADVLFTYDPKALLQFDPLTGDVRFIESMLCDLDADVQPPPPPDVLGQLAYLKAHNAGVEDTFGDKVAVSGDTVVIGAKVEDGSATTINGADDDLAASAGAAYVFVRDAGTGTWVQQAYLKASNGESGDRFGAEVAIDGDTIVVGAENEDGEGNSKGNSGAAYVFVRSGESWTEEVILRPSDAASGDWFGGDVAISGDTIVVGAYRENQAFVFTRNGQTWTEQQILTGSNTESGDSFGRDVTIDGDTIVVGAFFEGSDAAGIDGPQDNNNRVASGAAYVFTRNAGTWSQQAYLKASDPVTDDLFGGTLSLSGNTLAVGVYHKNQERGAAYIFVRDGSIWSQQDYLEASNMGFQDDFGAALSLSGDLLVVGAAREDGEGDTIASDAGAVYAFRRDGVTWSEIAYLKASNFEPSDWFGRGVGISGKTMVAGAFFEDSSESGGEADNSTENAGAAYIFNIGSQVVDPGADITPPVVTPPADIANVEATGLFTPVAIGEASVTDDSGESLIATPGFAGPFRLGITSITWSATDSAGNTGTARQFISVVDTTNPVVVAPADIVMSANGPLSTVVLGTAVVSDNAGPVESLVNDAPDFFPVGTTVVTWTATDSTGNSDSDTQSVTVTAPELMAIGGSPSPLVDGMVGYGEWADTPRFTIDNGFLAFRYTGNRLYILVDLLADDVNDPLQNGGGDEVAFYFDIDEDGANTPGVDLRYRLDTATGNLLMETACDGCPGGFNSPEPVTFSARAVGFGCFIEDRTFSLIPFRCANHRAYELALDLVELDMREDYRTRMGFEVVSGAPAFTERYPADLADRNAYFDLRLKSAAFSQPPDGDPGVENPLFEVTQATQTTDNAVDLVAEKRTAVRIWQESRSSESVRIFVYGSRAGVDLPGSPLLVIRSLWNPPPGIPPKPRDSVAFNPVLALPASWTNEGSVNFEIGIHTHDYVNVAELSAAVNFLPTRKPVIWSVPLRNHVIDGETFEPDIALIAQSEDNLKRVAPIGEIEIVRRPVLDVYNAHTSERLKEQLREFDQMTFLAWFLGLAINGEAPFDLPEQTTGFTSWGYETNTGTTIGSSDPVGLGGDGRITWAFPRTAPDSMLWPHELNHNLDQAVPWTWGRHVIGCRASGTDPNWPYVNTSSIQEVGVFPTDQFFSSVRDVTPDFMSYCGTTTSPAQWFSPYRWQAWVDEFRSDTPPSAALKGKQTLAHLQSITEPVNLPAPEDSFYVLGRVHNDGSGEFTQVLRQPGLPDPEGPTGDYKVHVADCGDATLAENSFSVFFEGPEGEDLQFVSFSFILPAPPASCSIELLHNDSILDVRTVSANVPTVEVITPNGGESWEGLETVEWSATDQDGDDLQFTVLFSADAGLTWQVLATRIDASALSVDSNSVPGSDLALIRVLASDGANTGEDDSDAVFSVSRKVPAVEINSPTAGQTFNSTQMIKLSGIARDTLGYALPDDQLVWSTTGGIVGSGSDLSINLPEGNHTIALIAMDMSNLAIENLETVDITVSDEPGEISFDSATYTTTEDQGMVTLRVLRSGTADGPAVVHFYTRDGVAVSGGDPILGLNDYESIAEDPANYLEWADGEAGERFINIHINKDVAAELTESFEVMLTTVVGETLGIGVAEVSIISDFSLTIFSDGFE